MRSIPLHMQAMIGLPDGSPDSSLEAPFQVQTEDFLAAFCVFNKRAAERVLPEGLRPTDSHDGFIASYNAPNGWGLAPFSAFFVGVFVQGHESPDGSPGTFMAEGYYSGRAGPVMHTRYNQRLHPGTVNHKMDGRDVRSEVGPQDLPPVVRLLAREVGPPLPLSTGIHHYLGAQPSGLTKYSVAFSARYTPAEMISYEVMPDASEVLQALTPESWVWSSYMERMPLTFSAPRMLSATGIADDASEVMFLDLLSRLGRGALLVDPNGKVKYATTEARAALGPILRDERICPQRATETNALSQLIDRAEKGESMLLSDPVAVRRGDTDQVVFIQSVTRPHVEPASTVLLLVSDATRNRGGDPTAALELFGLTRAEARLAGQVGLGLSPREAAQALGVTENTARSTLKIVFDKMRIGRQSELARIVARMEAINPDG